MSAEEYWYGKPWLAKDYYKAEKYRMERENFNAWLYGAYVVRALSSTVCNMFVKDKVDAVEYPDKPIQLFNNANNTPDVEEDDKEAMFARAYMMQMMQAGANWGKNMGDDDGIG